jgi:hypothetical protein
MTPNAWPAWRTALRAPEVLIVVGASTLLVVVVDATQGLGTVGGLGALAAGSGRLTFGRLAILCVAAGVAARVASVSRLLHTHGLPRRAALADVTLATGLVGLAGWALSVVVVYLYGTLDAVVQSGPAIFGAPFQVGLSTELVRELRLAAEFVVTALVGGFVGWIVGRPLPAVLVGVVFCVPYVPFLETLTNRAPGLLTIEPYLPFGSVEAVFGGYGGLIQVPPLAEAKLSPARAVAVTTAWLAVLAALAWVRSSPHTFTRDIPAIAVAVPIGLVLAAATGAALPALAHDTVPWPYRPAWRHADASGWSSTAVTRRWVAALKVGDTASARRLFATRSAIPDANIVAPLAKVASVHIPLPAQMSDPYHLTLVGDFSPPQRRPGVITSQIAYTLVFHYSHGRFLIARVDGPSLRVGPGPR